LPARTPIIISIAGSDPTACSGIQADIKTASSFGIYCATVVTAVTAQSSGAVLSDAAVSGSLVALQLQCLQEQFLPGAVKLGMLGARDPIEEVVGFLRSVPGLPIVYDPVFRASSGGRLITDDGIDAVRELLLSECTVITPNFFEAAEILGIDETAVRKDVGSALRRLAALGPQAVVLTGGDEQEDRAIDYFYSDGVQRELSAPRVEASNSRGTGCTFSTALACGLLKGLSEYEAAGAAKTYTHNLLKNSSEGGLCDKGPLLHFDLIRHRV
jgi:hydroxymethylpyrimidine/phosphomethylpyrimidine kinase